MKRCDQILCKYQCGCIGFKPFNDGSVLLVESCQACDPEDTPCLMVGKVKNPDSYKMISEPQQNKIFMRIRDLIYKGHKMETVQRLLSS